MIQTVKTYLGDAVYVELDVIGRIRISTSDGIKDTNEIYFEPEVTESLIRWLVTVFGKEKIREIVG
jgi:hypothetical protein